MKHIILLFSFTLGTLYANKNTYSLTVIVNTLRSTKGELQIALYNKEGTIPDKAQNQYLLKKRIKPVNRQVKATFGKLPEGRYAISIYHDENNNGKIDKGFLLPEEGVGISNFDSIDFLHLPNFKSASFELNRDTTVPIKIHYF
jgi:uncharacterized protein (DUF2141 family)